MKQLAILLTIFLLTAFTTVIRKDDKGQPFKVEIAYRALPDPVTTEYTIDNQKMILAHVRYDYNESTYQTLDKSTYKDFDRDKIISFLKQTDWSNITDYSNVPSQTVTSTTEGPHYIVKVEIDNKAYNFDILNTYNPTFASLFTICNNAIPNKEKRNKYYFPYK